MQKRTIIHLAVLMMLAVPAYSQTERPVVYLGFSFDKLKIIDPTASEELGEVKVSVPPFDITLSKDGKTAYVYDPSDFASSGSAGLSIVDLETKTEKKKLFADDAVNRVLVASDGLAYAVLRNGKKLVAFDQNTFLIQKSIDLPAPPLSFVFSPDETRAYVTMSVIGDNDEILEVDIRSQSAAKRLTLPGSTSAVPNRLGISKDGRFIYIGTSSFGNQQGVIVVDNVSFSVKEIIPVTGFTALPQISPDGKTLYVRNNLNFLTFISIPNHKIIKEVFSEGPDDLKLSPDGGVIYASTPRTALFVFDAKSGRELGRRDYSGIVIGAIALRGDFSIGEPPSVQTLSPKPAETIQRGKQFPINWLTAKGEYKLGVCDIDLSTDGGSTFKTVIAKDLPGDALQFLWNVPPNLTTQSAVIRVSVFDIGGKSASSQSGVFSIGDRQPDPADVQPPNVRFVSPLGGEMLRSGDAIAISWISSDNIGVASQDLVLSIDGGASFSIAIASGLAGQIQSFNYKIPDALQTERARLRLIVRDAAGNSAQAITGDFKIQVPQPPPDTQVPTVTITKPMGDVITAGQPITVNWKSEDNVGVISQSLLLSLDGGASHQTISNFGAVATSFTISNAQGLDKTAARALVKITAADAAGNTGEQTAQFSLAPAIMQASYMKLLLTINGIGFTSNNPQAVVKVIINGIEAQASKTTVEGNTKITVRGAKKKLNLVKGANSVQLIVDAVGSNTFAFSF